MCGSTSNIELKCLSMLHVACGQTVNEAEHKLNDSHEMWLHSPGIKGNELVDKLAKEAAVEDGPVVYDKIPREVLITRVKENGLNIWQQQWTNTGKGAVTKAFFPSVRNRLREKIHIFSEFTILVTGHGKLRSYLHRFGIKSYVPVRWRRTNFKPFNISMQEIK